MTPPPRLAPVADRDSAPWWAALGEHDLIQQRCQRCGRWRWPPRALCGDCGSLAWSWQPILDTGVVISWIRTHHAFLPGFVAPYDTVLVRLDLDTDGTQDDVVLPGSWFGSVPPVTGMAVRAHFEDLEVDGGPATLLGWEPLESGGEPLETERNNDGAGDPPTPPVG